MPSTILNGRYLAIATDIAAWTAIDADFAYLLRTDPGTALTGYGIGLDDLRGSAESPRCAANSHVPLAEGPRCAANSHVPLLIEPEC